MFEKYKSQQPIAYKIFSKITKEKKFSHAYLIETNGYDKGYDLGLAFAKAILCPIDISNCQNCNQCQLIDGNNFTELKIINPDGNLIKKDQLSELQEEFNMKALIGNKKVYILNQAEKLNLNASNSILKFLEEPVGGITAILITDNKYQLIDTILSRCQIISLNGFNDLKNYNDTFFKIGQLLTNNEEEFQEFVSESSNQESIKKVIRFANFYENNHKKTILYLNQYWFSNFKDKIEIQNAIIILLYYYKDILNNKIGHALDIFDEYAQEIEKIAIVNEIDTIVDKINAINQCRKNIDYNANLNLLIDKLIIQMEGGIK